MKKLLLVFAAVTTVGLSNLSAEEPDDLLVPKESSSGGWRISAGLDYRFRYKTSLKMNTSKYNAAHPAFQPPQNNYPSRDEVIGNIGNGTAADGRRDYDNGFLDPSDSGTHGASDQTWNWAADEYSQYNSDNQSVSFDSYYGVTESSIGAINPGSVSDEKDMAGLSLDFGRTLWQNENFALGASVGFSYFPERTLLSAHQKFAAGSYRSEVWRITDTYNGNWGTTVMPPNASGGLGNGTFNGPGPLLPDSPASRSDNLYQVLADETFEGGAWVESEMWLAELRFCLEPEWKASDRFSVLSNFGVAIEYADISTHSGSWMNQSGQMDRRSSSSSEEKWIIQGILGLGARYMVTDSLGVSLSGEARVPETEVDVDSSPYEGDVEFGTWSAGAQLDYFF